MVVSSSWEKNVSHSTHETMYIPDLPAPRRTIGVTVARVRITA